MTDLIVIGAGLAGLSAGRHLKEAGYDPLILEARSRPGGRVQTHSLAGVHVEMGAQWIHGSDGNPLVSLAREAGIESVATDYADIVFHPKPHSAAVFERFLDALREYTSQMEDPLESVATASEKILSEGDYSAAERQMARWALSWYVEVENAASASEIAARYAETSLYFQGMDHLIPAGWQRIVEHQMQGLKLRFECVVDSVDYSGETIRLDTCHGSFNADRVISTLPLGVMKRGLVDWQPPLPQRKQEAITHLEMGTLAKVFLVFDEVFWDREPQYLGYSYGFDGWSPLFVNLYRNLGKPILEGGVSGHAARQLEYDGPKRAQREMMRILREMYGPEIPEPTDVLLTQWSQDPFSCGSYSCNPPGADDSHYHALGEAVDQRLFFAGEATSTDYMATGHGALLSGIRAAQELIDSL